MATESVQIQRSGAEKRTTLEEVKSCLEKMASFDRKQLNPQAMLKAEEERNNKSRYG